MRHISQRQLLPATVPTRTLGNIVVSGASTAAALNLAQKYGIFATITTNTAVNDLLIVRQDLTLYEGIADLRYRIPDGKFVDPTTWGIVGPWEDLASSDGKESQTIIDIINKTPFTDQQVIPSMPTATDNSGNTQILLCAPNHRCIATAQDNSILFVYVDASSKIQLLMFTYSTNNGATWSTPQRIAGLSQTILGVDYDIALDGNNNAYIVYQDNPPQRGTSIYSALLSYSNNAWAHNPSGDATIFNADGSGISGSGPTITVDSNSKPHCMYSYYDNINYNVVVKSFASSTWTSETTSFSTGGSAQTLFMVGTTATALVYQTTGTTPLPFYISSLTGSTWSAPTTAFNLGNSIHSNFSVCVDNSNNIHVVVRDADSSPYLLNYYNYNGTSWSAPTNLAQGSFDMPPNISTDGSNVYMYWAVPGSNVSYGPLYRNTRTSGTWGTATNVYSNYTDNGFYTHTPSTVALGDKAIMVDYNSSSSLTYPALIKLYRNVIGVTKGLLIQAAPRGVSNNPNSSNTI